MVAGLDVVVGTPERGHDAKRTLQQGRQHQGLRCDEIAHSPRHAAQAVDVREKQRAGMRMRISLCQRQSRVVKRVEDIGAYFGFGEWLGEPRALPTATATQRPVSDARGIGYREMPAVLIDSGEIIWQAVEQIRLELWLQQEFPGQLRAIFELTQGDAVRRRWRIQHHAGYGTGLAYADEKDIRQRRASIDQLGHNQFVPANSGAPRGCGMIRDGLYPLESAFLVVVDETTSCGRIVVAQPGIGSLQSEAGADELACKRA